MRLLATPWIEYYLLLLLRRKAGLYIFDTEPFVAFWKRDPAASFPTWLHHALIASAWALMAGLNIVLSLGLEWLGVFHYLAPVATFCIALETLAIIYHLGIAALAAISRQKKWYWSSSGVSEIVMIIGALLSSGR